MGIYGHTWDNYRIDLHPELIDENTITDTLKKFIDGIKTIIVNAIDKINSLLDKHPDSKIAQGLKSLLTRFKNFLTRADKVNNKEDATKLKSDVDEANEELKSMTNKKDNFSIFDHKVFKDALEKRDKDSLDVLRESLGNLIYVDRSLKTFDKALKDVQSKINIMEDYNNKPLISEQKKLEDMTDSDFSAAIYWLKENFCKERINDVKKIGKYLYGG